MMPDAIINAAGRTDLAWCEANAREAVRSNLEAPNELYARILAHNSGQSRSVRFLHFSSGCIWDGPFDENGDAFTPTSPVSPACLYSWTKAASDALLLQRDPGMVAVLRPRQVFSSLVSPRNTLSKLLRYPGLIDTPNSMSSANIIIKTVEKLLRMPEDWSGVWNIYDKGYTTPFHVGELLAKAGLRAEPQRITKDALDVWHTPKRVDAVLYDERFETVMKPNDVEDELRSAIEAYKLALVVMPS
jgi:dTDP-4-dehydrorhamnose reductase